MLTDEQLKNTPFSCDITNEKYHASAGLSNSSIGMLLDCPKKYWDKYLNPDKPPQESSPALRFGNMVHCYLLEHEEFYQRYVVGPDINKNSNEYKAFKAECAGRIVIDKDEEEILQNILKAVNEHKFAKHLLKNGHAEQSIFWHDSETGVLCKTRPDYMTQNYIVDVKTTRGASWEDFGKSIKNYGYHRQAALALAGREAISGLRNSNFINLCIEPERPYIVSPFLMSDEAIQQGILEYKRGLRIFKECSDANHWPVYVEEIEEISVHQYPTMRRN